MRGRELSLAATVVAALAVAIAAHAAPAGVAVPRAATVHVAPEGVVALPLFASAVSSRAPGTNASSTDAPRASANGLRSW